MSRLASLTIALVFALVRGAPAQAPRSFAFAVSAQLSVIPLYEGDATIGRYSGLGPSLRLAYEPRFAHGRGFLEGHGTRTLAEGTRYRPRLTSLGLMLGAKLGRPTGPVRGLVAAGISRLHVDAQDDGNCLPPLCFAEGGGSFSDADLTMLTAGLGLAVPGRDRLAFRADIRVHAPISSNTDLGDSGDTRLELAAGLMIQW